MRYPFILARKVASKRHTIMSVGKNVEKMEPSYVAGRNAKWCSHLKKKSLVVWQVAF
jgi:hypothetical protein